LKCAYSMTYGKPKEKEEPEFFTPDKHFDHISDK